MKHPTLKRKIKYTEYILNCSLFVVFQKGEENGIVLKNDISECSKESIQHTKKLKKKLIKKECEQETLTSSSSLLLCKFLNLECVVTTKNVASYKL